MEGTISAHKAKVKLSASQPNVSKNLSNSRDKNRMVSSCPSSKEPSRGRKEWTGIEEETKDFRWGEAGERQAARATLEAVPRTRGRVTETQVARAGHRQGRTCSFGVSLWKWGGWFPCCWFPGPSTWEPCSTEMAGCLGSATWIESHSE